MAPIIILSMDVRDGERKIRKAMKYVAGIENVEVYPDTGRVVVTGSADAAEVVTALESKLRVNVTIVCRHEPPKLEFSSDEDEEDDSGEEDDDDDDDDDSSGGEYYYKQTQPANLEDWAPWNTNPDAEWHGMGFPAIRTREPWSADQPVPDPSSWFEFFNFNMGNNSPPEGDDE